VDNNDAVDVIASRLRHLHYLQQGVLRATLTTKAARKAVLKGYRVLRGPFFVAALRPTGTSAFREECGPCGGDGAEWWPCATILGHAGGWPSQI
jgi:hypothetical protein